MSAHGPPIITVSSFGDLSQLSKHRPLDRLQSVCRRTLEYAYSSKSASRRWGHTQNSSNAIWSCLTSTYCWIHCKSASRFTISREHQQKTQRAVSTSKVPLFPYRRRYGRPCCIFTGAYHCRSWSETSTHANGSLSMLRDFVRVVKWETVSYRSCSSFWGRHEVATYYIIIAICLQGWSSSFPQALPPRCRVFQKRARYWNSIRQFGAPLEAWRDSRSVEVMDDVSGDHIAIFDPLSASMSLRDLTYDVERDAVVDLPQRIWRQNWTIQTFYTHYGQWKHQLRHRRLHVTTLKPICQVIDI